MTIDTKLSLGLLQMNSQADKKQNLKDATREIRKLSAQGAKFIMMPEHFNYIGPDSEKRNNAESLETSPSLEAMRALAKELQLHIHIGSFLEKKDGQVYNTGVLITPSGENGAIYRKLHLFDVEIPGGLKYLESDVVTAGSELTTFNIGKFVFGMATCYDLRFPELFRALMAKGANVLLVPAAFTLQTGRDHWELLLRARAVENLSYVIAVGQWGVSATGNISYGRSMVIDPWGIITAQAGDGFRSLTAELDYNQIEEHRVRFPALQHIRRDLFQIEKQ